MAPGFGRRGQVDQRRKALAAAVLCWCSGGVVAIMHHIPYDIVWSILTLFLMNLIHNSLWCILKKALTIVIRPHRWSSKHTYMIPTKILQTNEA